MDSIVKYFATLAEIAFIMVAAMSPTLQGAGGITREESLLTTISCLLAAIYFSRYAAWRRR